jgi:hypothetical protein
LIFFSEKMPFTWAASLLFAVLEAGIIPFIGDTSQCQAYHEEVQFLERAFKGHHPHLNDRLGIVWAGNIPMILIAPE